MKSRNTKLTAPLRSRLVKNAVMLPVIDVAARGGEKALARLVNGLRGQVGAGSGEAKVVAGIIEDVRRRGDRAVVGYMRKWTDPDFEAGRMVVSKKELRAAEGKVERGLRKAIGRAIGNVERYQRHIRPVEPGDVTVDGAELGLRFRPVGSVGLLVPGGRAVLFSTVVMLAVPALVAGVEAGAISVVNPPATRRRGEKVADVSAVVPATCAMLGIERVYRIGGAQAVAALAYGTERVERVEMVAGPGNVYVQLAKAQLNGTVGTDNGFYGPSEIVTVADSSADPARVAADLIAQAEHDPGKCFLISWSRGVIEAVVGEVERQVRGRVRLRAIEAALRDESAAILVRDEGQAAETADLLAGEHVNLAVREPGKWLERLRNGGEFFLGDQTPVAAGDYLAGPSHCLPTGTTARFASGVSVYTFLKRSGTVCYKRGMSRGVVGAISRMAEAEGLEGHAESVRARKS